MGIIPGGTGAYCSSQIPVGTPPEHIFSSLEDAMNYLRDNCIVIPDGITVEIKMLSDQSFDSNNPLSLNHPYGERILINGTSSKAITATMKPIINYEVDGGIINEESIELTNTEAVVLDDNHTIGMDYVRVQRTIVHEQENAVGNISFGNATYLKVKVDNTPSLIYQHSSVLVGDIMYVFGGYENNVLTNKLWSYDIPNDDWTLLNPPISPSPRANPIVYYDGCLYNIGSFSVGNDGVISIWKYVIADNEWIPLTSLPPIPSSFSYTIDFSYSAVVYGDKIIVVGGDNGSTGTYDCFIYDITNHTISVVRDSDFPVYGHTAVVYGDNMYIIGGNSYNSTSYHSSIFRVDLTTFFWTEVFNNSTVCRKRFHSTTIDGNIIYIYGGIYNGLTLGTSYTVNLDDFSYTTTPVTSFTRERHSSVFYGGELVIFGGRNSEFFNTLFSINTTTGSVYHYGNLNGSLCEYNGKFYEYHSGNSVIKEIDPLTREWVSIPTSEVCMDGNTCHMYNNEMYYLQGTDFRKYNFVSGLWIDLLPPPSNMNKHTAVVYNNKLYVYSRGAAGGGGTPEPGTNQLPNNTFSLAGRLYGNSGTVSVSNIGATLEAGEFNFRYKSMWSKWVAHANGTLVIDNIGSGFDTVLSLHTVIGSALMQANDNAGGGNERITYTTITAGTTYYIRLGTYKSTTNGTYRLNYSFTASTSYHSIISVYDFLTGTWSVPASNASYPTGRLDAASVVYNNLMYVSGGSNDDNTPLNNMYSYNFGTNTWTQISGTQLGVFRHNLIVNGNGELLTIGGKTSSSGLNSNLYRWNSLSSTWETVASNFYSYDSSVLLYNDDIYITGGYDRNNYPLIDLFKVVYDPHPLTIGGIYIPPTDYLLRTIKGASGFVVKNNSNLLATRISMNTAEFLTIYIGVSVSGANKNYIIYSIPHAHILVDRGSVINYNNQSSTGSIIVLNNSTITVNNLNFYGISLKNKSLCVYDSGNNSYLNMENSEGYITT